MKPQPDIHCRRILVPTDFSELAQSAALFAVALSRRFRSRLHLVHVVPTNLPADISHLGLVLHYRGLALDAARELHRWRSELIPPAIDADELVLRGTPHFEICRAAVELKADLVVLPTHGLTGLSHLLLGSTAERVVRHAPCPVLVIPRPAAGPQDATTSFKRILVPTDLSESAAKAFPYAAAFAREFQAAIHLLHVVEPPRYPVFGYARVPMQEARACRAARQALARLCIEPPFTPLLRVRTHIRTGNASLELAEAARTLQSDLIIMATHGRTALAHAFLGSTAEKTVRHAPCPILLVRQKQQECIPS